MKLLVVSAVLLVLAAAKKKDEVAADPNAALAKAHGGKVWSQDDAVPALSGTALRDWIAARPAASEIGRKTKEGPWTVNYLAVFKKPAAKGPMTVQFFDKKEPKDVVDQDSPTNDEASVIFKGNVDLDPDHGFNKGHTYLIKVGQIIKGHFQPYATGELSLK